MKKNLCVIFALMLFATVCRGGSIQWNVATWGEYSAGNPFLEIRDKEAFPGLAFFDINVLDETEQARIICLNGGGYFSSMLMQVGYGTPIHGDLFSATTTNWFYWVYSNKDTLLGMEDSRAEFDLVIPLTEPDFSNTVILAFELADLIWYDGLMPGMELFFDYRYGWVELGYDGTDVFVVASAMSKTEIFAGVIPEPSTALLALAGVALLVRRRRGDANCSIL